LKFTDLELKESLQKSLKKMGFENLTPIQEETFPHVLKGSDLMGLAETGSGKTSACGIPLVQTTDENSKEIQALVIVPTRELALQYVDEIDRIADGSNIRPFAVFGGFSMDIQKAKLKDGVQILIATPGRLIDLIYNDLIDLKNVKTFVLDEADEMLNMGFSEDIHFIMSCMVQEHQTLMFSATMPKEIEGLANECLQQPVRIELTKNRKAPQSLTHAFSYVKHTARVEAVLDIMKEKVGSVIIFINSRHGGDKLKDSLKGKIRDYDYIHGGLDQNVRTSIFSKFKSGKLKVLIATDVAGRGLDFAKVTHVINYDLPRSRESYTHRTGRAGRMGREGKAITFITPKELGAGKRLIGALKLEKLEWVGDEPDFSDHSIKEAEKRSGGKKQFNQHNRRRGASRVSEFRKNDRGH